MNNPVFSSVTRRTASHSRQATTRNDAFAYNDRSELASATLGTTPYAYAYDNIGNRETAQEAAQALTTYAANPLNQYSGITQGEETPFTPEYDTAGNQTKVKTSTGIWTLVYDANNRPTSFTSEDGQTVISCGYDFMGRRFMKKVTVSEAVTLHQFYLYRGYLQIAALDLTRSTLNALWFVHWDPTEPVATRPLSIRKNATWYTYGHDLTKNVTELYNTSGTIATAYDYSPFGAVTATGIDQPFQWSSEIYDAELGMVYYNYRHYNPSDGRWISRDIVKNEILLNILLTIRMNLVFYIFNLHYLQKNLYKMIDNNTASNFDVLGNTKFTQEELDEIIKELKETEKSMQDCLNKHHGGGKFKINPRLAFSLEEQAKSPNCLAHALGCPFPLGANYEDSIKELNKDCQEVPMGPCQQGQHQVLLYGLQTPPGNYHVVRGNNNGSWSAAVGGSGTITDITDPEKNTKAWYEDCMKDYGMDPQKIDQSKTKRYCCCDRK